MMKEQLACDQGFVMASGLSGASANLAGAVAGLSMARMNTLEGQLLIAMPGMEDDRFADSVILVVGHGEEGAMGLVVNQKIANLHFSDIIDELDLGDPDAVIRLPDTIRHREVMRGGPVEKGRGFVLHSSDYHSGNTYRISEDIALTATLDVLKAMTFGPAPRRSFFALGCCGWSAGQLESEIAANGWLTAPYNTDLIFDLPVEDRYDSALASLNITRATLSMDAGHG